MVLGALVALVAPMSAEAGAGPAPTAVNDLYSFDFAAGEIWILSPIGVLANDVPAVPGQATTARVVSLPTHGLLTADAQGGFRYQVTDVGFTGDDTWTYVAVAADGTESAPATVTMRHVPATVDNRPATTIQVMPTGISPVPLGVALRARVVRAADGVNVGGTVLFSQNGQILCIGSSGLLGYPVISCTVDLVRGLPILLGAPVTVSHPGSFLSKPSTVTTPLPFGLL